MSLGFRDIDDVKFFGIKDVLATSRGHADLWVRLPTRGFLLVFCSNHNSKMHGYELKVWDKQTDGQMDEHLLRRYNKSLLFTTYAN